MKLMRKSLPLSWPQDPHQHQDYLYQCMKLISNFNKSQFTRFPGKMSGTF